MKKKFIYPLLILLILLASFTSGALADRLFVIKPLDYLFSRASENSQTSEREIVKEESIVVDVAEKVSPSVVTISIETPKQTYLEFDPFSGFKQRVEGGGPQDIGSGFIISKDGLVVTNKHVVSVEGAKYKVITADDQEYEVTTITRDPANDLAVLKIDATDLSPVELGDSSNLKAGQFVVAIGTALGEFRHTVTTGVISGLGRGITAGSVYEGYVERLDDVIQTDAAINPGNSGGPLLNSSGAVIGVNVAVAAGAENIGFAIPINIVKKGLEQFNATGKFATKPFLGVQYQMISTQTAVLNNLPEGAFIIDIVPGSSADHAGMKINDILIKFDGKRLADYDDGLSEIIEDYNPGDKVDLEVWRDGETLNLETTLSES